MSSNSPHRGWDIWSESGGRIAAHFISTWSGDAIKVRSTTSGLDDNEWHHCVITYDGSSDASGFNIYIDGLEESVEVVVNSLSGSTLSLNPVYIGRRDSGASSNYTASDIRIYRREISPIEVNLLYNELFSKQDESIQGPAVALSKFENKTVVSDNLVGLWEFDNKSFKLGFLSNKIGNSVVREWWSNGGTTNINTSLFSTTPTGFEVESLLEGPTNWANSYTTRFRGYVRAPSSGDYTFWCAGDDTTELYLNSSGQDPSSATRVSYHTSWTSPRQWTKFSTQKSSPITLSGGEFYYIELRSAEASGGDNVAAGWSKPGEGTSAPSEVIGETTGTLFPFITGSISGPVEKSRGITTSSGRFSSSGFATIPYSQILASQDFAVSFWVRPDNDATSTDTIMQSYDHASETGFVVDIVSGNNIVVRFGDGSSQNTFPASDPLGTREWSHVCITATDRVSHFYINGVAVVSKFSNSPDYSPNNSKDTYVGCGHDGTTTTSQFAGSIGEIRWYDKLLSVSEVRKLYKLSGKRVSGFEGATAS
jgi:hypothetical protein